MARKLGFVLAVLLAGFPAWGAATGGISGYVKNTAGEPQMGAMVEVFTSILKPGATVFTDSRGFYSAENLPAGTYQVKVTSALFLPSLREDVSLRAGAHVLINMTLNTLADALRLLPPRRNGSTDVDDWHWTLRSTANRPILRIFDGTPATVSGAEKGEDRTVRASVAFIAGAQGEGFGSSGEVTTAFALEKSLFSTGTLSLKGDIASASGVPAGVLHAAYTHELGTSHPSVTITWRHFASPGTTVQNSPYDAIAVTTSDSMSVAGFCGPGLRRRPGITRLQQTGNCASSVWLRESASLAGYGGGISLCYIRA